MSVSGAITSMAALLPGAGAIAAPFVLLTTFGDPPEAPFTSRAAESDWGDPVAGLSIRLAADRDSVPLGGEIRIELFFRYDAPRAGEPEGELITDRCVEEWALLLRDVPTGRVWEREPYEGRPIGHVHTDEESAPLRHGHVSSGLRSFSLLGIGGGQVPAGEYDLTVRYRNTGDDGRYRVDTECGAVREPQGPFWSGELETGALRLRVLPRDADTTRCRLPTAIDLRWDEDLDGLVCEWHPDSWEDAVLLSRPGHHVAIACDVSWDIVDPPIPVRPLRPSDSDHRDRPEVWGSGHRGRWCSGGLPDRAPGFRHRIGGPDLREVAGPDAPVRVKVRMRIYDTPDPDVRHGGSVDRGRILREREMVAWWPRKPSSRRRGD